jgi:hypothetical protein
MTVKFQYVLRLGSYVFPNVTTCFHFIYTQAQKKVFLILEIVVLTFDFEI